MADHIDMANDLAAAETARHIAAARQPIPVGVSGECEQCGYCRDGRRRPR